MGCRLRTLEEDGSSRALGNPKATPSKSRDSGSSREKGKKREKQADATLVVCSCARAIWVCTTVMEKYA
eukprot:782803-Prorocentrum_lima.AAC.1